MGAVAIRLGDIRQRYGRALSKKFPNGQNVYKKFPRGQNVYNCVRCLNFLMETTIRIKKEHVAALKKLKIRWGLKSLDEVVRRLLG